MSDDVSSRIIYTNFSLRDIEKSIVSDKDNSSLHSSDKKGPGKITVSKFEEQLDSSEVDRLNGEIKYLEELYQNTSQLKKINFNYWNTISNILYLHLYSSTHSFDISRANVSPFDFSGKNEHKLQSSIELRFTRKSMF